MKDLLFSAQGRLARGGFWKGVLLLIVVTMIGGGATALLGSLSPHDVAADGSFHVQGLAAIPVLLLAFSTTGISLWSGLCIAIKRYHDRDKSGLWVLIQLVPIVGPLWYFVETGFLAGTPGPNRFGPDPRGGLPLSAATIVA